VENIKFVILVVLDAKNFVKIILKNIVLYLLKLDGSMLNLMKYRMLGKKVNFY
jgi:hypothetical protein